MKKQIALLLSLVLVVSLLTACGSKAPADDTPSTPPDNTQTDTPNTDDTQEPETPDAADPGEDQEQTPEEKPKPETPESTAPSLTLDKNDFTLFAAGESYLMTATANNTDKEQAVVWTSSDPSIATVKDGLVTAVAPGTCTITATAGDLTATCVVRCNWQAQSTGGEDQTGSSTAVDLSSFFDEINGNYELASMSDLDGELLANYYPGLSDYTLNQCVAKASMISAVVSEVVLVECASAEDAAAVAEILQARIDAQVDGGAWYPASIEQWEKAQLVTNGNYVAMIACGDNSASIAEDFLAKF